MKISKAVVTIIALLMATPIFAQVKIAYIRIDDIVGLMPELAPATFNVDTVGAKYIQDVVMPEITYKQNQYNEKIKAFSDTAKKYSDAAKRLLLDEITALQTELGNADQYIQQVRQEKQQQFLRPFYAKAKDAITLVAKEKGYTHVMSTDVFLVAPEADDISLAVLQKLNIKMPAQNNPAGSPAVKPRIN